MDYECDMGSNVNSSIRKCLDVLQPRCTCRGSSTQYPATRNLAHVSTTVKVYLRFIHDYVIVHLLQVRSTLAALLATDLLLQWHWEYKRSCRIELTTYAFYNGCRCVSICMVAENLVAFRSIGAVCSAEMQFSHELY